MSQNQSQTHEIGDVVILKSGGPPMTVHNVDDYSPVGPNPGVLCIWFVGGDRKEEVFHPKVLAQYSTDA